MKKKKLSSQQIKFIINMLSLALFVFSYFYIYTGYVNKEEAAYAEVNTTKQYMEKLEKQLSEEDSVRQETEAINTQIETIIDSFPVKIAKEDNLMFIEQMQKALNISFTSINISDSVPFYETILPIRNEDGTEVDQTAANAATIGSVVSGDTTAVSQDNASTTSESQSDALEEVEGLAEDAANPSTATEQTGTTATDSSGIQTMTGLQSVITMNFKSSYKGFKELMDFIASYPDKTVIDSVSVSYDNTTGNLTGSLVLKRFALTGTGKVYETPMIEDISIGTDNIFGTDVEAEVDLNSTEE